MCIRDSLDASTRSTLSKGARNVEILKQGQYQPIPVEKQIAIIYCGTKALLKNVPVNKVHEFERDFIEFLDLKHRDVLETLKSGVIDDSVTGTLEKVAADIAAKYEQD
jgi:F-type H+-transporting ATPase subunit alpha